MFCLLLCFHLILFFPPFPMFICFASWTPHMSKIIWYLSFSDWLILLSIISIVPSTLLQMTRFHSFWWLSNIPVYVCVCVCVCVYHIFCIHSCVNGHLGSFHILAIMDIVVINIRVHVLLWITIFVRETFSIYTGNVHVC